MCKNQGRERAKQTEKEKTPHEPGTWTSTYEGTRVPKKRICKVENKFEKKKNRKKQLCPIDDREPCAGFKDVREVIFPKQKPARKGRESTHRRGSEGGKKNPEACG